MRRSSRRFWPEDGLQGRQAKKDGVQSPIETPLKPHHIRFRSADSRPRVVRLPGCRTARCRTAGRWTTGAPGCRTTGAPDRFTYYRCWWAKRRSTGPADPRQGAGLPHYKLRANFLQAAATGLGRRL